LDARFPGQWFQSETGLHYNWHRSYDPTLGRYTQPDPLGFVDGPSVYAYAGGSPQRYVDRDGRFVWTLPYIVRLIIVPTTRYLIPFILPQLTLSLDPPPRPEPPTVPELENCPKRCEGLLKQLLDHIKKLKDYTEDPSQFDNKDLLGKGRDEQIIEGRKRSLRKQIDDFRKQLEECLKNNA
jgi:RHS repeat-associated protein